jgi:hypothetical protein
MSRTIGFDREIRPEWMDYMASLYSKGLEEKEARESFKKYLSMFIQGKESRRKLTNMLIKIWYKSNNKEDLELLKRKLPDMDTKKAYRIYLDLIRKSYPFFDDVCTIIGRVERLNGNIDTKNVIRWIAERWGDHPRVEISTKRAIRTYQLFKLVISEE